MLHSRAFLTFFKPVLQMLPQSSVLGEIQMRRSIARLCDFFQIFPKRFLQMFHMLLSEKEEIVASVDTSAFSTSTIATKASRTSSISFLKTKFKHLKFLKLSLYLYQLFLLWRLCSKQKCFLWCMI